VSARDELTVAEIARIIWEACGEPADRFELEHLPSFDVDVPRRWPSVDKARDLLGWEAQIDVRDGIAQTVEWLREQDTVGSPGS
jgi:UDP-glucose 4-epimerase